MERPRDDFGDDLGEPATKKRRLDEGNNTNPVDLTRYSN